MTKNRKTGTVWFAAALLLLAHSTAFAQATRTWVSGVGDDANPCSRTAPCKTFAGAISKTAAGGEIDALDPAGYGGVTITKSITINGAATNAGVLVSGTNGIVVNAGASDVVVLRNLNINGNGTGLAGVNLIAAGALHVDNVDISDFNGTNSNGIKVSPSAGLARVFITNTRVTENGAGTSGGGIYMAPTGSGYVIAEIANTHINRNNGYGLRVDDNAFVTIRNSDINASLNNGVLALSSASPSEILIDGCMVAHNGWNPSTIGAGVSAQGAAASVRINSTTIYDNEYGIRAVSGGNAYSFGNNRVTGNSTNGSPTGTLSTM